MEIKSLNNLEKNGQTFELFADVYVNDVRISVYPFTCTDRHEGRIDLVCDDIYKNTDNIDILMQINSMVSPFLVQNGNTILFVEDEEVDRLRKDINLTRDLLKALKNVNKGKEHKKDNNRLKDVSNRKQNEKNKTYIPTNLLKDNNQIQVKDGKIIIRPNF